MNTLIQHHKGWHPIFLKIHTMLKHVLHVTRKTSAFQEAYGQNGPTGVVGPIEDT